MHRTFKNIEKELSRELSGDATPKAVVDHVSTGAAAGIFNFISSGNISSSSSRSNSSSSSNSNIELVTL